MKRQNRKSNKNLRYRWGKPTEIIEGVHFNIHKQDKKKGTRGRSLKPIEDDERISVSFDD